ncbi:hypothetical protein GGQ92_002318 [Gracilibacillus halotolerans]|uniref:TIGR01777 family protein n=1 Tax=Gracilibacillus halotolerans TaxID=74386 RepID=A0A841RQ58_9BACI|nr:TIGR01777 family oxidoreductase [Gracilibacillus halotolerans]MBB6513506.1 hypothetical protein [Gracilibacillus halotolerans]
MRIVIAGGSGFIGEKLSNLLVKEGHKVIILTRKERDKSEGITYVRWLSEGTTPEKELENIDAIINLAGVSINDGRWTEKHKEKIVQSRMIATDELIRIVERLPHKPSIFMNASAIGIYPVSLEATYTEASKVKPNDFLGRTVLEWERKAEQLSDKYNIRTTFMRFGVVLGKEGGALPLMTLPYKLLAGGTIGSGKQWVSWIHVEDVVRAISFVIKNNGMHGPINVTAPSPVRMKAFGKTIGTVLGRPHWFPVPSFAMRLALGEKSKLVLEGQKVVPFVLLENKFEFLYPKLDLALKDLLK